MLKTNLLKQKLKDGESVLGTWSVLPYPGVVDIIGTADFDFIILDNEHGPLNYDMAQTLVSVCESRGLSPIVRVPGVYEEHILHSLDIGAHGIQVPNVSSADEVRQIVKYAKYPPIGNRGFSPFTRAGGYNSTYALELSKRGNQESLIAINLEGPETVSVVPELLKINELDVIFVGLFDLSKALGIPGQVNHSEVKETLFKINKLAKSSGKAIGTIATSYDTMEEFLSEGLQYIVYLVDCAIFQNGLIQIKTHFESQKK